MRNWLLLTKVLMKTGASGLSSGIGGTSKKRSPAVTVLLYVIIGLCLIPYITMAFGLGRSLTQVTVMAGQPVRPVLETILFMGSIMTLVFGISYILTTFFLGNDLETLLPLPLTGGQIVLAKLTVVYVYEVLTNAMLILPVLVGHGIGAGWGVGSWILGIVVFLLMPVVPLAVAGILSTLLMYAMRNVASRSMITTVSTILLLVVVMLFSSVGGMFGGVSGAEGSEAAADAMIPGLSALSRYSRLYPLLGPMAAAVDGPDLLSLLITLAVCAAAVVLFLLVAQAFFVKTVLSMKDTGAKGKAMTAEETGRALRRDSALKACAKKEWRMLYRSPQFFLNTALLPLIWPVFLLLPAVVTMIMDPQDNLITLIRETLPYWDLSDAMPIVILVVCGATIFGASTSFVSGTSMSREGANYIFMKCIPVRYRTQLTAKLLVGTILTVVATTGYSLIVLLFLLAAGLPPVTILFAVLVSLALNVICNCFSMMIDLLMPKLHWENEQMAVKQNFVPILEMLLVLVIGGGLCFLYALFSLILGFDALLVTAIFTVVMIAAAAGIYALAMAYGEKRLTALEE